MIDLTLILHLLIFFFNICFTLMPLVFNGGEGGLLFFPFSLVKHP